MRARAAALSKLERRSPKPARTRQALTRSLAAVAPASLRFRQKRCRPLSASYAMLYAASDCGTRGVVCIIPLLALTFGL